MSAGSWKSELSRLTAVLGAWHSEKGEPVENDEASQYRELFSGIGNGDPSGALKEWSRRSERNDWVVLRGYFRPAPVKTKGRDEVPDQVLWPLISIAVREISGRFEATLRVVLYATDDSGVVDAWGWRFDSADPQSTVHSHPYSHVQHITNWEPGWTGFLAPGFPSPPPGGEDHLLEIRKTIPETRPAVPLNCSTPAGLAVAAMLSIYGGRTAAQILRAVSQIDGEFASICGRQKLGLLEAGG